ncbi:MAG TPA: hypothetical protein VK763_17635 [Terriglobales bacterium]|jgi:hypothetical protein|nr:hypothetical protein [Terriglobales bacterium]
MNEIASELTEPAQIAGRLGNETAQERGPRRERAKVSNRNREVADPSVTTPHRVDSLA